MRVKLTQLLLQALQDAGVNYYDQPLDLHAPKQSHHGDYATSLPLRLAKYYKQSPASIATQLITAWNQVPEIDLTPLNGFINIHIHPSKIMTYLYASRHKPDKYAIVPERILLEYVSANPTGPLHIGHGRWGVIGSCLAAILREVGHTVHTETYVNNAGAQIDQFRHSVACVRDNTPVPASGYHGEYIQALVSEADPVQAMMHQHAQTLARINCCFDTWFYESDLHQMNQIYPVLDALETVYEKDGAKFFKSSQFGDDKDRVLVKSDGSLTYFAVDIAYHAAKLRRQYTHLITLLGADHHGYVARMQAAMRVLSANTVPLTIRIGQLVSLSQSGTPVRMSKRSGEMITLDDLIDKIGPDATRFFLVYKSSDTHVDIDLDQAVKRTSDNPVYYIQYAHARLCQVFAKVSERMPLPDGPLDPDSINAGFTEADRPLFQHLLVLHDIIATAATQYAPHYIATYAQKLAGLCHRFYEKNPVLTAPAPLQAYRIGVMQQLQWHLKTVCDLLGITAPTRM